MKRFQIFLILFLFVLIFTGCAIKKATPDNTEGNNDSEKGNEEEQIDEEEFVFDSDLEGEIQFWTWSIDLYEHIIEAFNKEFPNIKVNLSVMETGELHDKLATTLAAGTGAPDVSMVEVGNFPRYTDGDLLEDLLQPPYNIGRYQDDVPEFNWEQWKSVDGEKMYGIPHGIAPGVFFYRQDIYEQYGLPSEPEELGEYIQDPSNFLYLAQTLTANDMYIMEFNDSPFIHLADSIGYYDSELNYLRNTEELADRLDFVKEGTQLNWAPHLSALYSEEGNQLLKQGKLVSAPMGSWAVRQLETIVPDQAGKWKATRMPLGADATIGGSTFVIPSQSKNKEAAWAFLEWMVRSEESWKIFTERNMHPAWKHITSLPWYQEQENEFLGGQKANKLYAELSELTPVRRYTKLDGKSWPIFIDAINESIEKNIDSKTTLQQIEENIYKQLGPEIDKLKKELGIE